ncbi:MAG: hypothetical protein HY791_38375 [Deltaproteobacteria bacterium]|nr:hypothetical protein [Deltaproteobacteria bacterium]
MDDVVSVLHSSWTNFLELLKRFLPQVLAMLLIVIAGWVIARLAAFVIQRTLQLLHFGTLVEKAGAGALMKQANAPSPERIVAKLVFWIVWMIFMLAGMNALGLQGADLLVADLVRLVPRLIVAVAIVLLGVTLSNFVWRATLLAAVNAGLVSARLIGGFVRAFLLFATAAMALEQLEVAGQVVHGAFMLILGAVMLSGAIAFGLGGRDLARRFLEEKLARRPDERDGPPHV